MQEIVNKIYYRIFFPNNDEKYHFSQGSDKKWKRPKSQYVTRECFVNLQCTWNEITTAKKRSEDEATFSLEFSGNHDRKECTHLHKMNVLFYILPLYKSIIVHRFFMLTDVTFKPKRLVPSY